MSRKSVEGGLVVNTRPDTHEIDLVAESVAGETVHLVVPFAGAIILQAQIANAIDEVAPNDLERMRAQHLATFGDANVPDWVRESIARYVDHGIPTGDFLRAVLANDLEGAFARADVATARVMPAIVSWVYNRVPRDRCGNYAVVDSYVTACVARRRAAREQAS